MAAAHGHGNVIAAGGEGYATRANALGGWIKAVQRDAPATEVVDDQS